MPDNFDYFSALVQDTFDEVGDSAGYSLGFISGWYLAESNLGKLNNSIDKCFAVVRETGNDGEITGRYIDPELNFAEQSIYKKWFEYDFYNRQLKFSLSGVGGSAATSSFLSVKEGDSQITRVNRSEVAKTFRGLARDAKEDLDNFVNSYLSFGALPHQVAGDDDIPGAYYDVGSRPLRTIKN